MLKCFTVFSLYFGFWFWYNITDLQYTGRNNFSYVFTFMILETHILQY